MRRIISDPKILGGNVKAQIQAIRDHLFVTLGGSRRRPAITTND